VTLQIPGESALFSWFEAFGLTILEAMISRLANFHHSIYGSSEIIQNGENGFHINPYNLEENSEKFFLDFINQ